MKIATWNVNSIRARLDRAVAWLQRTGPDVACLQELKSSEEDFPRAEIEALGYRIQATYQRTYNGVAILSRHDATAVVHSLDDGVEDPQARLVAATVDGLRVVCVYVPNGGVVGSDKYAYKLAWMGRLRAWLERHHRPDEPLIVCGDLNIAPEARDVHDPALWENESLFHVDSRRALQDLCAWGLQDALRLVTQEAGIYSWWDYRMLGFPKNRGLRIDHVLVTEPVARRVRGVTVERNERKGKQPSDHAPVVLELD
ncbi:MAG: exodeoxyribonuclease III [Deltaproteobacteria bacterium]|nr:exodeoxyribonuclease III [Deltaproteobacteria bacterium]